MQLRLKLTDSCLYFLYTDVKWCVLLYIITLYCTYGFFLEVKIVVFFSLSSPVVYLGCSEGILCFYYGSNSSGFFIFLFVLMNMLIRYRIASTGRGGVWCIRWCTIYGVLHGSHL